MTFFGKPKRKRTSPEASRKSNTINRNNNNNKSKNKNAITNEAKYKDRAQTSLNLAQPPPPYSPSAPLQTDCWPSRASPYQYQYLPTHNPVSQVNLAGRPLPPGHRMYEHQDVKGKSCTNLPATLTGPVQGFCDSIDAWHNRNTDSRHPGAGLCDLISSKLNTVLTLIDGERFSGDERELGTPR